MRLGEKFLTISLTGWVLGEKIQKRKDYLCIFPPAAIAVSYKIIDQFNFNEPDDNVIEEFVFEYFIPECLQIVGYRGVPFNIPDRGEFSCVVIGLVDIDFDYWINSLK